jgi:hypothetical protein
MTKTTTIFGTIDSLLARCKRSTASASRSPAKPQGDSIESDPGWNLHPAEIAAIDKMPLSNTPSHGRFHCNLSPCPLSSEPIPSRVQFFDIWISRRGGTLAPIAADAPHSQALRKSVALVARSFPKVVTRKAHAKNRSSRTSEGTYKMQRPSGRYRIGYPQGPSGR